MSPTQISVGSNVTMIPLCLIVRLCSNCRHKQTTNWGFPSVMAVAPLLRVLGVMPSACYIWGRPIMPNLLTTL